MKKVLKENRVLLVLFIILVICFIAICGVTISYFVGSHKSVYGDRLNNKVEINSSTKKDYIAYFESDETIDKVTFRQSIRTIYVKIFGNANSNLNDLRIKCEASIEKMPKEVLEYYDLHFTLVKPGDDGFTMMGAKNISNENIAWNNNTPIEEE